MLECSQVEVDGELRAAERLKPDVAWQVRSRALSRDSGANEILLTASTTAVGRVARAQGARLHPRRHATGHGPRPHLASQGAAQERRP